jgi:hypothetical protein
VVTFTGSLSPDLANQFIQCSSLPIERVTAARVPCHYI